MESFGEFLPARYRKCPIMGLFLLVSDVYKLVDYMNFLLFEFLGIILWKNM